MFQSIQERFDSLLMTSQLAVSSTQMAPEEGLLRGKLNRLFVCFNGLIEHSQIRFDQGNGVKTYRLKPLVLRLYGNIERRPQRFIGLIMIALSPVHDSKCQKQV